MKNKRYIALGIVVLLALGVVIGLPQVIFAFTGEGSCELVPYSDKCFCEAWERKIDVTWVGVPKWSCETIEMLLIDPESPTFETDAVAFVKTYLTSECGNICEDLSCGGLCIETAGNPSYPIWGQDRCISALYGYDKFGARLVNVECVVVTSWDDQQRPSSGTVPWRMNFFVESETDIPTSYVFLDNYCTDADRTQRCEPYMEELPYQFSIIGLGYKTFPEMGSSFPPAVE